MSEEIKRIITIEDNGSETLKKLGDAASDTAVDLNKVTVSTTELKKAQTDSLQGISDVGGALGQLNPKVGQLTTGVGNFRKALNALKANPIILAISAVVGIVYGLVKAIKSNKEAVEQIHKSAAKFKPLVDTLKKVLDGIVGTVTKVVTGVLDLSAKILGLSDSAKDAADNTSNLKKCVTDLAEAYDNLGSSIEKSNKRSDINTDLKISQYKLEIAELEKKKKLATDRSTIDNIEKEITVRNRVIERLEIERNRQKNLNSALEEFFNSDEFKKGAEKAYKDLKLGEPISDEEIKAYKAKLNEYNYIITSAQEQLNAYLSGPPPKTKEQFEYNRKRVNELIQLINDTQMLYNSVERQLNQRKKDASTTLEQYITDLINTYTEEIDLGQGVSVMLKQIADVWGEHSDIYKVFKSISNKYQLDLDNYFAKNLYETKKVLQDIEDDEKALEKSLSSDEDESDWLDWTEAKERALQKARENNLTGLNKILGETKQTTSEELDQEVLATEEANRRKLESDREYAAQKKELLFNTATAMTDSASRILLGIAQAQDQNTAAGLEAYKKFATASAIISTAGGVMAAIKSGLEAGGPVGWVLAVSQAGAVLAEGYAQLAAIKRAGESSSTSSTGLSAAAKTTVYSPYSTTANIGSASIGALSGIIGDQKVYVTEGDITKAQNAKKVKVEESRL